MPGCNEVLSISSNRLKNLGSVLPSVHTSLYHKNLTIPVCPSDMKIMEDAPSIMNYVNWRNFTQYPRNWICTKIVECLTLVEVNLAANKPETNTTTNWAASSIFYTFYISSIIDWESCLYIHLHSFMHFYQTSYQYMTSWYTDSFNDLQAFCLQHRILLVWEMLARTMFDPFEVRRSCIGTLGCTACASGPQRFKAKWANLFLSWNMLELSAGIMSETFLLWSQ